MPRPFLPRFNHNIETPRLQQSIIRIRRSRRAGSHPETGFPGQRHLQLGNKRGRCAAERYQEYPSRRETFQVRPVGSIANASTSPAGLAGWLKRRKLKLMRGTSTDELDLILRPAVQGPEVSLSLMPFGSRIVGCLSLYRHASGIPSPGLVRTPHGGRRLVM